MENFNYIELHRTRDFSRKLNATFEFIKQNFKPFGKSILFIAGPCVLVASLLLGSFMKDVMSLSVANGLGSNSGFENQFLSVNYWLTISAMILFYLLSTVMALATINSYIVLYGEKKTNQIPFSDVWARVRTQLWTYLGSIFLFALVVTVVGGVIVGLGVALMAASPAIGVFYFIAAYIGFIYAIVGSCFTFIIQSYEKLGFFEALTRSLKLVTGKWWSTFGLLFILSMVVGVMSYVIIIPFYVITFISAFHEIEGTPGTVSPIMAIVSTISITLYYATQMLLSTLPHTGIAFQYFNLVELKESKGLLQAIDSLGQQPPTSSSTFEDPTPTSDEEQY